MQDGIRSNINIFYWTFFFVRSKNKIAYDLVIKILKQFMGGLVDFICDNNKEF